MADFSYFIGLIDDAIEADKGRTFDSRLINDLVDQCKRIASNPSASSDKPLNERYHSEFYLEFLSIGLTLVDDFTTTYGSAGRLLNNVGYDAKKGNKGHRKELPVLLAWYFWKSADCGDLRRFDTYKIDWTSAKNAKTDWFPKFKQAVVEYKSAARKPHIDPSFYWVEPHRILTDNDQEAIEEFKEEIRRGPEKPDEEIKVKRDWIDPYNTSAIPFVGREDELEQLDAFAGDREQADFKIWIMVAPSGAGKTRLTYEWLIRSKIADNWQAFYLALDTTTDGLDVVSQDVVQLAEPFGWRLFVESIVRSSCVVPVQISGEVLVSAVG